MPKPGATKPKGVRGKNSEVSKASGLGDDGKSAAGKIKEAAVKLPTPPAGFHMKKALKRKVALVEKYNELKAKGKLNEFMEKRRKKMQQRDRLLIPRAQQRE